MNIKLEKWGDDLALPLPLELVEKYGFKDGDCLNLSEDSLRRLFSGGRDSKQLAGDQ